MKSINPFTGEIIMHYEPHSDQGAERIVSSAAKAWHSWRHVSFEHRANALLNLAGLLRSRADELARLISLEMGKVYRESLAEIEKCAWVCEYYAGHGEAFLMNEPIAADYSASYVSYKPLGVILAVMPWNFPFWQVFRAAVPALMAGNTMVLKHASNVTGCSLAIESLFRDASFPENAFRSLLVGGSRVETVIAHPAIKGVTLTGSTPAGKAVASAAGVHLKKCVLELGGSDPYLILKDADLAMAARVCATSRLLNAGQSCIAAKRFIIEESVYPTFVKLLTDAMSQYSFGDPFADNTSIGPLARTDLRDELHLQVERSVGLGAQLILGGYIPDRVGAFYPATVLGDVTPGMPAYFEELFGPVAALIKARNEKEAVEIANDTAFGLGAAVFTNDTNKGRMIAEDLLAAGCCFVNDFVKSDPRLPFGGIGESGFGRELSAFGIREFVNIKTVVVK